MQYLPWRRESEGEGPRKGTTPRFARSRLRISRRIASSIQLSVRSLEELLEHLLTRIEASGGGIYLCTEQDVPVTRVGEGGDDRKLKRFDETVLFSGKPVLGKARYLQPISVEEEVVGYLCVRVDSGECSPMVRELIQAYAIIIARELELVQNKSVLERYSLRLLEKKQELQETQQYSSNLLSITTHDLSSPLNAVSGYLDLMNECLEEEADLDRILDYHKMIQSGIQDISDMLNQLNEVARIEKGLVSLRFTKMDLCWLIEETCDLLKQVARRQGRTLSYRLPDRRVYAEVDFVKLKRVVYNLVSNAIKYTEEGGNIRVSVETEGERALIRVADDGMGISEEDRKAIFEPFVKLKKSGGDGLTSSGLGLFISSYFTRQMHGELSVESAMGEGSTFTVSLPMVTGFQQSISA